MLRQGRQEGQREGVDFEENHCELLWIKAIEVWVEWIGSLESLISWFLGFWMSWCAWEQVSSWTYILWRCHSLSTLTYWENTPWEEEVDYCVLRTNSCHLLFLVWSQALWGMSAAHVWGFYSNRRVVDRRAISWIFSCPVGVLEEPVCGVDRSPRWYRGDQGVVQGGVKGNGWCSEAGRAVFMSVFP